MDKIWLKNYPKKMPETIDAEKYSSLIDLFDKNCQKYSHKYLLNSMGVRLTFKQVDKLSRHFAAFLQQHLGLRKSQRFAIMMPNLLQYPVAILGALRAGLTIVNVNPLYTPRELIHQLNDAEVEAIIVLNTFASVLQKALPKTQIKHVIVTQIGDLFGFPKGNLVNWVVKYLKQACPAWEIEQAIMFKQAMQLGNELKFEAVAIGKDDLAFLQYTGGTTGLAKGAMLSHGNVAANVVQGNTWLTSGVRAGKELVVTALPLYHIFSLTVCFWCFVEWGGGTTFNC